MKYVADAHSLIWFVTGSRRLGPNARIVFGDPASDIYLPAIALAEACWVVERGRTSIASTTQLLSALVADTRISVVPLDRDIVELSLKLTVVPEMHDRQIVATGLHLARGGDPLH